MTMQYQSPPKNPALAAVLSFLINGLGQIYNGEVGKGILIMVVQVVNALLTMILIGFVTGPIVFVWSIYDAYKTAERINAEAAGQIQQQIAMNTKVCPQCAERVPIEAKVCRYCGYRFEPVQPAMLAATESPSVVTSEPESTDTTAQAASSIKTCPNCGAENNAEAKFCMSCGHMFDNDAVDIPGL